MTYNIRIANKFDIDKILEFNRIESEELKSEFFCTKLGENSCFFIIENVDTGEILGTQGYIGYPMYVKGESILTGRSERTLLSQKLRGGGWFNKLILSCDEYFEKRKASFIWGNTSALKAFSKSNFSCKTNFRSYCVLGYSITTKQKIKLALELISVRNLGGILKTLCKKNKDLNDAKLLMECLSKVRLLFRKRLKISEPDASYEIDRATCNYEIIERINKINYSCSLVNDSYFIKYTEWLVDFINARYRGKIEVFILKYNTNDVAYYIVGTNNHNGLNEIVDFGLYDKNIFEVGLRLINQITSTGEVKLFWIAINAEMKMQLDVMEDVKKLLLFRKGNLGSMVIKSSGKIVDPCFLHLTDLWNLI